MQERKVGIQNLLESKLNETKSSAGDKFETGRTMIQLEEQKAKTQLSEIHVLEGIMSSIVRRKLLDQERNEVSLSSLVLTDQGSFFIAIGLGKMAYDGQSYFCISRESPIGSLLLGKQQGNIVQFNSKKFEILEVY